MANRDNRRTELAKMLLKSSLIKLMQDKRISRISIRELCREGRLRQRGSGRESHYVPAASK